MAECSKRAGMWVGVGMTLLGVVTNCRADDARQFDEQVRPLLARHCVECHRGDKPKGNLRLDNLMPNFADAPTREHWSAVVKRLEAG